MKADRQRQGRKMEDLAAFAAAAEIGRQNHPGCTDTTPAQTPQNKSSSPEGQIVRKLEETEAQRRLGAERRWGEGELVCV